MDEAAARARLVRMVAATSEPTLTDGEVDDLLAIAARPDADGLERGTAEWVPTWELNSAAAEGWRWKAGKAVGDPGYSADGASWKGMDVKACLDQAAHYDTLAIAAANGGAGFVTVAPRSSHNLYDPRWLGVANL